MTKYLITLLMLCLLQTSCKEAPPTIPTKEPPASSKERFRQAWGNIIKRTEAINYSAQKITLERNLPTGSQLLPSSLGLKNINPKLLEGENPVDLLMESKEDKTLFWIHIRTDVPPEGETQAFAATKDPITEETIYYPKTEFTRAYMELVLLKLKNDQRAAYLESLPKPPKKRE